MVKTLIKKITGMDSRKRKKIETFMVIAAFCTVMVFFPQVAHAEEAAASGAAVVTSNFSVFTEIVKALVSSIGEIILLWGFFELGTSMQSQEGSMQASAFKRVGGGLVMVLAPQLLAAFVG